MSPDLTKHQVLSICADRRSFSEIAKSYHLSYNIIYQIKRRLSYVAYTYDVDIHGTDFELYVSGKDLNEIRQSKDSLESLSVMYALHIGTIELIKGERCDVS